MENARISSPNEVIDGNIGNQAASQDLGNRAGSRGGGCREQTLAIRPQQWLHSSHGYDAGTTPRKFYSRSNPASESLNNPTPSTPISAWEGDPAIEH